MLEILTVIAILGILAIMVMGNFIRSLKKARDSRRKQDLDQVKTALDIYYSEHESYPGVTGAAGLPWGERFTDGNRIFMEKLPQDPNSSNTNYIYQTDGSRQIFKLYSCLENTEDIDYDKITPAAAPNCGTGCNSTCHYGVSSTNARP